MAAIARDSALAIIKSHFGPQVAKIASTTVRYPCTLQTLVRLTQMPVDLIRKCLIVLIQHHIVKSNEQKRTYYTIDLQAALIRYRIPAICHLIESCFGNIEQLIVEAIFLHGTIRLTTIIGILQRSEVQHKPTNADIIEAFKRLVNGRIIRRINSEEISFFRTLDLDSPFKIPHVCLSLAFSGPNDAAPNTEPAQKSKRVKLSPQAAIQVPTTHVLQKQQRDTSTCANHSSDHGIYWRLNFQAIHRLFLVQECERIVRVSLGDVAAEVAKVLMVSNIHQDLDDDRDVPVSLAAITVHHRLPEDISTNPNTTAEWLRVLESEGQGMFHVGRSGLFYFDLKAGMQLVSTLQVERILSDQFGQDSLRLVRLLVDKHYLDQDQVVRLAMVERYAATRVLLNELFQAGIISCQEIPKAADRAPSRCLYLWHASQLMIVKQLTMQSHQALLNLKLQLVRQQEEHASLLSRSQLLMDTEVKGNSDGSQESSVDKDAARLISDRDKLIKVKSMLDKLESAQLAVDFDLMRLEIASKAW
eukprot:gene9810-2003_t